MLKSHQLSNLLTFVKVFIKNPKRVGAVAPSSSHLSAKIKQAVYSLDTSVTIVEAGPGTGAITDRIHDLNPIVVELDPTFYKNIKIRFNSLDIRRECITSFLQNMDETIGLVLSIPMKNNPQRNSIVSTIKKKYQDGKIKWCVIYSYGFRNPLYDAGFKKYKRYGLAVRNVPPAFVWVYE